MVELPLCPVIKHRGTWKGVEERGRGSKAGGRVENRRNLKAESVEDCVTQGVSQTERQKRNDGSSA